MKGLSVVIPVYNEESVLLNSISCIVQELDNIVGLESYELVIIDDGSVDATWDILESELCPRYPQVCAVRLSRNFGKEAALCAGLQHADAEAVVVMDADMQHPPALVGQMYSIWKNGEADVVEAIKRSRGNETLGSKLSAGVFYAVISRLSGFDLKNASDFKLMDRRAVEAWKALPEKNVFFRGMSAWVGFEREQILFDVAERSDSKSKWKRINLVKLALTSIAAFSSAPLHIITLVGIVFCIFSVFLGSSTLIQYATGGAVSGFTTVILLLLIIGGVIMIALGIIGEYLAKIYDEVKARPRFLVSDIIRE